MLCNGCVVLCEGRGLRTLQEIRHKGTKYLDEIFRVFQGGDGDVIDGVGSGKGGAKQSLYPSTACSGYLWRRKDVHQVALFPLTPQPQP
jgi:hypothetical protein